MKRFVKGLIKNLPVAGVVLLAFARTAFAAPTPGFVTGATNLLNDATSWLLGIIPAGAGAAIGYHALMKQLSDGDPASAAVHNRAMRNVLIGAAIGESAVGITKAFLSYFQ
ncbi:MAG: hypothetical protein PWP65_959 [Clostridia bacterium]|nr:hypothetical protein [Clostridia bacterium]